MISRNLELSANLRLCFAVWPTMIITFLDDSGSHDGVGLRPDSRVVGTAGFVMLGERCPNFDRNWMAILAEFGVHEFHMRSFAHSRGEFEQWPAKMRDAAEKMDAILSR